MAMPESNNLYGTIRSPDLNGVAARVRDAARPGAGFGTQMGPFALFGGVVGAAHPARP
jgi:hypothetical protein